MALSRPGLRWLCVLVITLSLSCGSDSNSPTGPSGGIAPTDFVSIETQRTVTSLAVSASETTLMVGATTTLYATATYSDGTSAVINPLWSSNDPAVATVSSSGTVTAVAPGTVTVIASNEGRSGLLDVTVIAPTATVSSVSVSALSTSLTIGATTSVSATATYSDGSTATVTPSWASSNAGAATVTYTVEQTFGGGGLGGVRRGAIIVAEPAECGTGSPKNCFRVYQTGT